MAVLYLFPIPVILLSGWSTLDTNLPGTLVVKSPVVVLYFKLYSSRSLLTVGGILIRTSTGTQTHFSCTISTSQYMLRGTLECIGKKAYGVFWGRAPENLKFT